jgi:hypothetical protein
MPCYLFTYHAYASWMPDRSRGYVKRGQGILPQDKQMHRHYVDAMKQTAVEFDEKLQRWAIAALLESEAPQEFELYFIATDATHVHSLLGWRDERDPVKMRSLVKGSLTRRINQGFGRRDWLAEGGSRKQVKTRGHFEYLVTTYLPKHLGWKWSRERGLHR